MVQAIARLKPGVILEKARSEMDNITQRSAETSPETKKGRRVGIFPLYRVIVGDLHTALWFLLGAVALVLLLACANVANMLLARAVVREKEMAVRATLGASRVRIIRQLLTESLLLALLGGMVGLFLAYWGMEFIRNLALTDIPRIEQIELNRQVLSYALGLSVLTGLVFGLMPALRLSRRNLVDSLKLGGQSSSGAGHSRLRDLLVVAEVAIALVLLTGAGLLLNSFVRLMSTDWGFTPENAYFVEVLLPEEEYKSRHRVAGFTQEVLARLETVPGIDSVTNAGGLPFWYWRGAAFLSLEGTGKPQDWWAEEWWIGPNYFRTLGVPILKGREYTHQDKTAGNRLVVINRSVAEKLWPRENPVGKQIYFLQIRENIRQARNQGRISRRELIRLEGDPASWERREGLPRQVVGVVDDIRTSGFEYEPRPSVYVLERPLHWGSTRPSMKFALRISGDPDSAPGAVKRHIWDVEKTASLQQIASLENLVAKSTGGKGANKLLVGVSTVFGSLALALVIVGVYGVISYSVSQRTHEIGVRMALGAQPRDIFKLVVGQGMLLTLIGVGVGLAASFALTRLLESLLFGVTPTDPVTFVGVAVLLTGVALLACYIPARRATKVDPMVALRYE